MISSQLPRVRSVLAVCAHPDDESFGLGALLAAFRDRGARTSVICFTRGEASTLHAFEDDLAAVRESEFTRAAEVLGVSRSVLLDYPDGQLETRPVSELSAHVVPLIHEVGADLLLVFDEGGVTGHPDHVQATSAALSAGADTTVPVLAWVIADEVAVALREEFGVGFVGRSAERLDFRVDVDRVIQHRAIDCHQSQSVGNSVLHRRLELTGDAEPLRWLLGRGDGATHPRDNAHRERAPDAGNPTP